MNMPTTPHPTHSFDYSLDEDCLRCYRCGVLYGGLKCGTPCKGLSDPHGTV